jgi:hypothetical protein
LSPSFFSAGGACVTGTVSWLWVSAALVLEVEPSVAQPERARKRPSVIVRNSSSCKITVTQNWFRDYRFPFAKVATVSRESRAIRRVAANCA